tara:strand:- start:538 stop:4929 length:4392 start_codon:yes stop_codon:yes gene_type:complete
MARPTTTQVSNEQKIREAAKQNIINIERKATSVSGGQVVLPSIKERVGYVADPAISAEEIVQAMIPNKEEVRSASLGEDMLNSINQSGDTTQANEIEEGEIGDTSLISESFTAESAKEDIERSSVPSVMEHHKAINSAQEKLNDRKPTNDGTRVGMDTYINNPLRDEDGNVVRPTKGPAKKRVEDIVTKVKSTKGYIRGIAQPYTTQGKDLSSMSSEERLAYVRGRSATPGSLASIIYYLDAVEEIERDGVNEKGFPNRDVVPNTLLLKIGGYITEKHFGETKNSDPNANKDIMGNNKTDSKANPRVKKSKNNQAVGEDIARAYLNAVGKDPEIELNKQETVTLGDFFKELYSDTHPDLVERFSQDEKVSGSQVEYQLTDKGDKELNSKNNIALLRRLLPGEYVRPRNSPYTQSKFNSVTGGLKGSKVGKPVVEAVRNLSNMPMIIDREASDTFFKSTIPVLRAIFESKDPIKLVESLPPAQSWAFNSLDLGPERIVSIKAQHNLQMREWQANNKINIVSNPPTPVLDQYLNSVRSVAEVLKTVAEEKNSVKYLDFIIQGYSSRIMAAQTYFDPTSIKILRQLIRNPIKSRVKHGNLIDNSLQQIYAMELLTDVVDSNYKYLLNNKSIKVSELLSRERINQLDIHSEKLYKWGEKLEAKFRSTYITDDVSNQLLTNDIHFTDHLKEGVISSSPEVVLDPELDADLIDAINNKGEDGLHFINGLIDFKKYYDWKQNTKKGKTTSPFYSNFTTHIDGKTSGIALLGMLTGNLNTAFLTGVLRDNNNISLLDNGDIRDNLQSILMEDLYNGKWDNIPADWSDHRKEKIIRELEVLSEKLFDFRDLHKGSTMTVPYGKELESFKRDIEEYLEKVKVNDDSESKANRSNFPSEVALAFESLNKNRSQFINALHHRYIEGLVNVLSPEAIEYRKLMKIATIFHAATNKLLKIPSPVGSSIVFGSNESLGSNPKTSKSYHLDNKKRTAFQYENEVVPNAFEDLADPRTGVNIGYSGKEAIGRSTPAPVHSVDAAIVAKLYSGNSWKNIMLATGGNAFVYPIYDAFVIDAMSFAPVVRESNRQFSEVTKNYNIFKILLDTMNKTEKEFFADINTNTMEGTDADGKYITKKVSRPDSDTLTEQERRFMVDMMSYTQQLNRTDIPYEEAQNMSKSELRSNRTKDFGPVGKYENNPRFMDGFSKLIGATDVSYEFFRGKKGEEFRKKFSIPAWEGKKKHDTKLNVWHGSNENSWLSNLSHRPFTSGSNKFVSVEHAYQTYKSGSFDDEVYNKDWKYGSKFVGSKPAKKDDNYNVHLMRRIIIESFKQNPKEFERLGNLDYDITHTQDRGIWKKEFPRILNELRDSIQASRGIPLDISSENKESLKLYKDKINKLTVADLKYFVKELKQGLLNHQDVSSYKDTSKRVGPSNRFETMKKNIDHKKRILFSKVEKDGYLVKFDDGTWGRIGFHYLAL